MANDWNTPMPDTIQLASVANDMGHMGFDVHTIIVQLNNGGWRVEMQYTDEDMQDGMKEFELVSHNGAVVPV